MSKNEELFIIMRPCIIVLLLDVIISITCSRNESIKEDDYSYNVCPISLLRKRRTISGYTRWKNDEETTPEFLVKVLDEDVTIPVMAINIQRDKVATEKIVVGGVMVPLQHTTPTLTEEELREYTRFIPPTTIPDAVREFLLKITSASLIPPIRPKVSFPKKGPIPGQVQVNAKHSLRDESPPVSPQFIARTPVLMARQFAPITPVAFSRRVNNEAVKPLRSTNTQKTITRSKSNLDDFESFQSLVDDEILPFTVTNFIPTRTPEAEYQKELDDIYTTTLGYESFGNNEENGRREVYGFEKDEEAEYNMMFYNELDSIEDNTKADDSDTQETYNERNETVEIISTISSDAEADNVTEEILLVPVNVNTDSGTLEEIDTSEEDSEHDTMGENNKTSYLEDNLHKTTQGISNNIREKRRPICNLIKLRPLSFDSPQTLPEIVMQLRRWAEESPLAKWIDITDGNLTTMENPIYMIIVDDPSSGQIISAKETVLVVAGIQGRDHHAVSAAMYVLYQLIERSETHTDLLSKFRFWIVPVFNPDGYEYSLTFPHRRDWSKNLRQQWNTCKGQETCLPCLRHGIGCTIQHCYGVNLDRNFEYQWIPTEELRAEHPCGSLYAGVRQLSEPETRALTHYLHEKRTTISTFIAFKEGDLLGIMYPYSHTRKKRAFDQIYRQRASRAAAAAYSVGGRPYVAGQSSEFLPLYAGGIEDWVDGHLGIDNTYTIMIFRPADNAKSKSLSERVVHEAYAAMDTLLLQTVEPPSPHSRFRLMKGAGHVIKKPASLILITFALTAVAKLLFGGIINVE